MRSPSHPPQDPYNNELLLDYLEGLVDSGTRDRIETHLQDDELEQDRFDGLRQLYEEYDGDREKVMDYLEQARSNAFAAFQAQREESTSATKGHPQSEEKPTAAPRPLYRRWIGIAATIAIVIVAAVLLFYLPSEETIEYTETDQINGSGGADEDPSSNYLATQTALKQSLAWSQEPYPAPEVLRSSSETPAENWADAYENKRFTDAAQLLDAELVQSETPKTGQYFFAGISFLQQDAPDLGKAIEYLRLALDNDRAYEEQARWYLALAYLQNGQTDQAHSVLQEVDQRQRFRREQARILLKEFRVKEID